MFLSELLALGPLHYLARQPAGALARWPAGALARRQVYSGSGLTHDKFGRRRSIYNASLCPTSGRAVL